MKTFDEIPLLPEIKESLKALGFTKLTEIQEKVIPLLLNNFKNDIHAQAQTGTGKTFAFGIPLLHAIDPSQKAVQALVVAPTRELVLQIYESLREISRKTNIISEPIYGGMSINRQIANIKRGAQIIIGTPGRLNDHLRRKTLSLKSLKIVVLDEADIMLEMGFKEEVESILQYAPKDYRIWLFSATVMSGIKNLIKSHMKDVLSVRAEKTVMGTQVKQYFCVVPHRQRIEALARFIEAAPNFYGIIFCQTKVLTSEVMERLVSKGFRANCLHGDMTQALRNQVIKGFRNKDFNILVATDVAARGIDVSDLTHVINFSMPDKIESYIHRIGRTGRAGKEGIAIMLVSPQEVRQLRQVEKITHISLQEIPVPPIEAIITAKMGAIADFIEQAKKPENSKLTEVDKALKEIIDSFTEQEIRQSFAVALEDKFFKDIAHENIERVNVASDVIVVPQEICMEIGQDTGFDEETIRNYLYVTCKLLPQEVTKVRVLNKKTFISIPENRLRECLNILRTTPLDQKSYKIYLVQDHYPRKRDRSHRRDGRRPFRGRREKRRFRNK